MPSGDLVCGVVVRGVVVCRVVLCGCTASHCVHLLLVSPPPLQVPPHRGSPCLPCTYPLMGFSFFSHVLFCSIFGAVRLTFVFYYERWRLSIFNILIHFSLDNINIQKLINTGGPKTNFRFLVRAPQPPRYKRRGAGRTTTHHRRISPPHNPSIHTPQPHTLQPHSSQLRGP